MNKPTFEEALAWHNRAKLTASTNAPSYLYTQAILEELMNQRELIEAHGKVAQKLTEMRAAQFKLSDAVLHGDSLAAVGEIAKEVIDLTSAAVKLYADVQS